MLKRKQQKSLNHERFNSLVTKSKTYRPLFADVEAFDDLYARNTDVETLNTKIDELDTPIYLYINYNYGTNWYELIDFDYQKVDELYHSDKRKNVHFYLKDDNYIFHSVAWYRSYIEVACYGVLFRSEQCEFEIKIFEDNTLDHCPLWLQTQHDDNLTTTSKSIVDAINEVNEKPSVQPDWSQNDETASDYVKNRTHYIEEPD